MIFYYQNKSKKIFLSLFLFVLLLCLLQINAVAQVTIPESESSPENTEKQTQKSTYISSAYTKKYSEISRFIVLSQTWYSAPKDIASRVSLNKIGTSIQYFEDGTPYLEKTLVEREEIIEEVPNSLQTESTDQINQPNKTQEKNTNPTTDTTSNNTPNSPQVENTTESTTQTSQPNKTQEQSTNAISNTTSNNTPNSPQVENNTESTAQINQPEKTQKQSTSPTTDTTSNNTPNSPQVENTTESTAQINPPEKTQKQSTSPTTDTTSNNTPNSPQTEDKTENNTESTAQINPPKETQEPKVTIIETKTKGRLFLKVLTGQFYTVYDLQFVPFISVPKQETTTTKSEKKDVEETIPLQKHRNTGFSLIVDIIKKDNNGTHKSLTRYYQDKKQFTETYQYTNRGALRTLTRNYEDGVIDRFLYYFTTNGLEEVFHQEANGSAYQQKYTEDGDLKQREEYLSDGKLSYRLEHTFDKNNNITQTEETNFIELTKVVKFFENKNIIKEDTFALQKEDDGSITQSLVLSTQYDYNKKGKQIQGRGISSLNQTNTQSEYAPDGTLIKRRFFENKNLKKEIEYKEERQRIETIYFNNQAVLKVYYKGLEKIKEEVIQNNKVVETRK